MSEPLYRCGVCGEYFRLESDLRADGIECPNCGEIVAVGSLERCDSIAVDTPSTAMLSGTAVSSDASTLAGAKGTALAIVSVLVIAFFAALAREMTRSAFVGRETPRIGESRHASELGAGLSNSPHDRSSFVVGSSTFTVKQPKGFVLLEDRAIKARIVHPPDTQLHLVYVTQLDAARIMNGDTPVLDRYVAIQSNRELDANVISSAVFEEVKSKIRSQGFSEAIPRNLRKVNEFLTAKGQSVEEALVIQFTETADSYTTTVLVKPGGQKVRVNTVTMRNLRGCCIMVASTAVCQNQDDIDWSKSVVAECAQSLK